MAGYNLNGDKPETIKGSVTIQPNIPKTPQPLGFGYRLYPAYNTGLFLILA